MNLYKVGISGITAAEANISTTAHNITNMGTPGYNRQSVMVSSAGAQTFLNGAIGRGVKIDGIARAYDGFLFEQLTSAQSKGAELSLQATQLEQISAAIADRTVGISPALTEFFASTNALASNPADPAVRQDLLGKGNRLVTQLNAAHAELQRTGDGINAQLATTVEQINSHLHRINELNQEIVNGRAVGGQLPNDLLDKRDQALTELSQLAGVTFQTQNDMINVSLSSGQALIAGQRVYPLTTQPSAADPLRIAVATTQPGSAGTTQTVELRDSQLSGGKLGALTTVRSTTLDSLQSQIGQMAVGLAMAFNAVHANGQSPSGVKTDFFKIGVPDILSHGANAGTQQLSAQFTPLKETIAADGTRKLSELTLSASDYDIRFRDGAYEVTRLVDSTVARFDAGKPPQIPGLTLKLTGTPAEGDTWSVQTTRNAARDIAMQASRPEDLATADRAGGSANGQNALALASLQTRRLFDAGTATTTELYAKSVNTIGVQTQAAQQSSRAQDALVGQKLAAQQALSGVVANVEYVNLTEFQNHYQASARIIDVASTLFDTLLGMRG